MKRQNHDEVRNRMKIYIWKGVNEMRKAFSAVVFSALLGTMALAGAHLERKGCPGKVQCPITHQVICKTQCPLHK